MRGIDIASTLTTLLPSTDYMMLTFVSANGIDFNGVNENRIYKINLDTVAQKCTGLPAGAHAGVVFCIKYNNQVGPMQIYIDYSTQIAWLRTFKNGSSYSTWKQMSQ